MSEPRGGTRQVNGKLLRKLREDRGWHVRDLAEKTGYSERNIERLEAGGAARLQTIRELAQALGGVEFESLLEGYVPPVVEQPTKGLVISCERHSNGLVLKFQGEINIQAENPEQSPQVRALFEFLKSVAPDNADISLLSIGVGVVTFYVIDTPANAAAIQRITGAAINHQAMPDSGTKEARYAESPAIDKDELGEFIAGIIAVLSIVPEPYVPLTMKERRELAAALGHLFPAADNFSYFSTIKAKVIANRMNINNIIHELTNTLIAGMRSTLLSSADLISERKIHRVLRTYFKQSPEKWKVFGLPSSTEDTD